MVLSHWCQLIEGLKASPLDFYKCIDEAMERRIIPGLGRERVQLPEGGLFSAKREYLRLTREEFLFDICAAPFGSGFFISCRLVDRRFPWQIIVATVLAAFSCFVLLWSVSIFLTHGILDAVVSAALILAPIVFVIAVVWFIVRLVRGCIADFDQYLIAIPVFGPFYERITRRMTYYRIDVALVFQSAVQNAIVEAIDHHTSLQGLRPLSELERKPVLAGLLTR